MVGVAGADPVCDSGGEEHDECFCVTVLYAFSDEVSDVVGDFVAVVGYFEVIVYDCGDAAHGCCLSLSEVVAGATDNTLGTLPQETNLWLKKGFWG